MTAHTKRLRLCGDAYSFRGLGRVQYQKTRPQPRTGILEGDGPVRDGAPTDPGEPRG